MGDSCTSGMSIVVVLTIWFTMKEESLSRRERFADRMVILRRLLQQKVVWKYVAFQVGMVFFVSIHFPKTRASLTALSGVKDMHNQVLAALTPLFAVLALLLWRQFLVNANWNTQALFFIVLYVTPQLFWTLVTVLDGCRNPWVYVTVTATIGIPKAVYQLVDTVLPTEIAETGLEGSLAGVLLTCRSVVVVLSTSVSYWIEHKEWPSLTTIVSPSGMDPLDPPSHKLKMLLLSCLVNYGLNCVSIPSARKLMRR